MNFRSWLSTQTHRDDPVGDLARDVQADIHMVWRTSHWWRLDRRLKALGAPDKAFTALRQARDEYNTIRDWERLEAAGLVKRRP